MPWTDHYWEAVNGFYWVPSYLGLKSIPRKLWEVHDDRVSIPKELTNPNGPLYRRTINSIDFPEFVRRQEETFNHIFNLTFSMLPGEVISRLFGEFINEEARVDYTLAGSAHCRQYPWIAGANVTTPDAFFLADDSVLAVEIKFNAKTSLDQLAKYVSLIAGEVIYGAGQTNLALLYIFPKEAAVTFQNQTSVAPEKVDERLFPILTESCTNKTVQGFLRSEKEAVIDVLSKLQVSCISWSSLLNRLRQYTSLLGESDGEKTLRRVLDGLALEIERHPLARISGEAKFY